MSNPSCTVHSLDVTIQRHIPLSSSRSKAKPPQHYIRNRTCYRIRGGLESGGGNSKMEAGRTEIAFFDVETTIPDRSSGGGYALLEFGGILVCPMRLVEVYSYSTLIRPPDLGAVSHASVRCNGITRSAVAVAQPFSYVADKVFDFLNGRVWAGHNITRFDCARIREAFAEIGRAAPEPKGILDTLPLLTKKFGRRAGDMKMASLATYFGLGRQTHRSLDDVRMNLEILKYCATVLFLESSLPDISCVDNLVNNNTSPRTKESGNTSLENPNSSADLLNIRQNLESMNIQVVSEANGRAGSSIPVSNGDPSNLVAHMEHKTIDFLQKDTTLSTGTICNSEMLCDPITISESSSVYGEFLEPDQVLPQEISAPIVLRHQNSRKINLLHRDYPLQLCCMGMRILFRLSAKYTDHAGRPKLNVVVNAPENLCKVLEICDEVAQASSQNSGSNSEWRPVLKRNGYSNTFSIRLHIPTVANGDGAVYSTEMYQRDPCGNMQKLVFTKLDAAELDSVFVPGTSVDAYFLTETFDFQQIAGIRLVARRLVVRSG